MPAMIYIFLMLLLSSISADASVRFVDLTGANYVGADADLVGLAITNMGLECEGGLPFQTAGHKIVSWKDLSARVSEKNRQEQLVAYTIHFRVKDRKGAVVHEQQFEYLRNRSGFHPGKVFHAQYRSADTCERDLVEMSKALNLAYATVEYWLTGITWRAEKFVPQKGESDGREAFSLEEQLKKLPKQ